MPDPVPDLDPLEELVLREIHRWEYNPPKGQWNPIGWPEPETVQWECNPVSPVPWDLVRASLLGKAEDGMLLAAVTGLKQLKLVKMLDEEPRSLPHGTWRLADGREILHHVTLMPFHLGERPMEHAHLLVTIDGKELVNTVEIDDEHGQPELYGSRSSCVTCKLTSAGFRRCRPVDCAGGRPTETGGLFTPLRVELVAMFRHTQEITPHNPPIWSNERYAPFAAFSAWLDELSAALDRLPSSTAGALRAECVRIKDHLKTYRSGAAHYSMSDSGLDSMIGLLDAAAGKTATVHPGGRATIEPANAVLADGAAAVNPPAPQSEGCTPPPAAPVERENGESASQAELKLREPSRSAFAAYRAHKIMGITQVEVAKQLSTSGRKISQGQVSRWVDQVTEWITAGNVLPDLEEQSAPLIKVDPGKLDMGRRTDTGVLRRRAASKNRQYDGDDDA